MPSLLDTAISAHAESAFELLARLVAAPSTVGSEQGALDVFADACADLGLTVDRLPFSNATQTDPRAGVSPSGPVTDGRFQVLATSPGSEPLTLLFNGHMDVVPASSPHLWTTPPFEPQRREGRMYGRGAGDMKGGFAIGYLAVRAALDVAPDLFARHRLGFLAVIEEECTGNGTLTSITEHGVVADEVVLLEPTDGGIMTGGVGVLWIDIDVVARSSHAQSSHGSPNAIDLGMRLVTVLRQWAAELVETEPDPTLTKEDSPYNVNLGKVHAGDWTSTAPATALFSVRCGFPRSWSPLDAEAAVKQVIHSAVAADDGFPVQPRIALSGLRARGYDIDVEHPLVRDLSTAHLDAHGVAPRTFSLGSTTDARIYLNEFDIPAVCFGAIAHDMHGIDESVELQSIVDAARTLARFLLMRFAPDSELEVP